MLVLEKKRDHTWMLIGLLSQSDKGSSRRMSLKVCFLINFAVIFGRIIKQTFLILPGPILMSTLTQAAVSSGKLQQANKSPVQSTGSPTNE